MYGGKDAKAVVGLDVSQLPKGCCGMMLRHGVAELVTGSTSKPEE